LGSEQRTVPGGFGSVRVASQAIIAALPALLSLMSAAIASGGLSWMSFVRAQGAWPLSWTILSGPFQWLACFVFVASGLALLGIAPFDSGFSADLQRGVESNLSGRRLALFQLGRFYAGFFWSLVVVVVFLGGWNLPESLQFGAWAEALCVLTKAYFLMTLMTWFARSNPRIRVDQTATFLWKVATPLAALALLGQTAWVFLRGGYG
jgi:NADH-quinone oxidoreductase subunit H